MKIELKKIGITPEQRKDIDNKLKEKKITDEQAEMEMFKLGLAISYKTLIFDAVKKPPQDRGADYNMERIRMKILDKLVEATESIEVTDEEYEEMKIAIKDNSKSYSWIDRSIVHFLDDFDIK